MRRSTNSKILALEGIDMQSIAFQSTIFFNELASAFNALKKLKKDVISDSEIVQNVSKIIAEHSGLNVTIDIGLYDPCVEIPMINKNNILINSFIRPYYSNEVGNKLIYDAAGEARGGVNLKTGKVFGVFKEVVSIIHLPVNMFTTSKFDGEEIAAITLHECGHLVTFYEYMSRSVTTNQALAGLAKKLDESGTIEERETILINVKNYAKLKDLDARELAKEKNNAVVEIVLITNIVKQVESELGTNVYDFNTWEYLSDQYASRNGAGRYLVTGLAKLYDGSNHISFRGTAMYLAMEAIKILLICTIQLMPLAFALISMDGAGDGTYDKPGARMKRVRDQIVENLKDKELSKDDFVRLKADLDAIDEVTKGINDRRQWLGVLWDAISPYSRKVYNQERIQQELESIAMNELFVKAAELKYM